MNALAASKANRTASNWLEADQVIANCFGKAALSAEFRLLLLLLPVECVSIKEAFLQSALSNRAFYLLLVGLKKRNIVTVTVDAKDRRVRLISLETGARAQLESLFAQIP